MDDNRYENLANTLKNSGLAASMNEAMNMAKEMIGTGEKVQDDFEKRSNFMTNKVEEMKKEKFGIRRPKIKIEIKNNIKEQVAKDMVENAQKKEPVIIRNEYETPDKKEIIEDNSTLNEIMEEEAKEVYEETGKEDISVREVNNIEQQPDVDVSEMFDFTKRSCE